MKQTNPFLKNLNDTKIEKELIFYPNIPVGEDGEKPKYTFNISESYHDTLDEQIFFDIMYNDKEDTLCSFMLSPEDVFLLAQELLKVYELSMRHRNMKQQRKNDIALFESMLNRKAVSKIYVIIEDILDQQEEKLEYPEYLVNVYVYREDSSDIYAYVLAYNFRLNLFKRVYAYVQNMIGNKKEDSLTVTVNNKGKEVHITEMIKRDVMFNIIKDMEINIDLYPDKSLDNLFQFSSDTDEHILHNVSRMIDIVKKDNDEILKNMDKILDGRMKNKNDL